MKRSKQNDEIIQRIEYVRNYLGLNKSRFSTEIGLKPQTYNNFIGSQASKPSVELILGIVSRFGANPGWLLNGSGPVFSERRPELEARFALPGVGAPSTSWGTQVAEPGQAPGWRSEPAGELAQKIAQLEGMVHSIEERVAAISGAVPGLREMTDLFVRLYGSNPKDAEQELNSMKEHLERVLSERKPK